MKLNEIKPMEGSVKKRMRVGRGIGCTKGKTCGRGVKGQNARTGVGTVGFEGGQSPLYRRLPKFGFTNVLAREFAELTLERLQDAIDSGKLDAKKPIDEETLVKTGVVRHKRDGIRLLGTGALKAKVELKLSGATKSAKAAVEKAGGKVELIVVREPGPKGPKREGKKAKAAREARESKGKTKAKKADAEE